MAVPKKKVSQSKRNMRRSHHSLKRQEVVVCPSCGSRKLAHHLCRSCGIYRKQKIRNIST